MLYCLLFVLFVFVCHIIGVGIGIQYLLRSNINFNGTLPLWSYCSILLTCFQQFDPFAPIELHSVLDFTHAHLHKCMHFFLCVSKFSNLHAHCACNFLVTNFKMNRNLKKLLISTNFQGIKSLCFLYFAICVVFSLLRPSFVHVPTGLCK